MSVGILTELRDGRVQLGRRAPFGIELLDLCGRHRLVGLARGPVHGLDPQDAVLLVIAGEDHSVTLLHGVKEGPATVQACRRAKVSTSSNFFAVLKVAALWP